MKRYIVAINESQYYGGVNRTLLAETGEFRRVIVDEPDCARRYTLESARALAARENGYVLPAPE